MNREKALDLFSNRQLCNG